ncbi:MCE family protein [Gordonia sp. LSe1-13]|uniref:MCE family protein n=1 Tax=Gordonia sesuvii TaxID=3116777 RepID=A0ABU7M8K2_9ACTN|nr:MCE family protein [Gordonia sp. LSe1-13]
MTRRRLVRALAVLMAALLASGCGVGLGDLPLPRRDSGTGDTYTITAEFVNALNLPQQAKVRLSGADIGEVDSMRVRDYTALVSLRIRDDVILPVGTRAELRSATPLGDVFVGLEPPEPGGEAPGGTLIDGDTIPLSDTAAAATVEEVLATSAVLVNGGVLRDLTTIVNGLGRTVGDNGDELAALIARSTRLISSLSRRSGELRSALRQTDRLVTTMSTRKPVLDDALAAAGPALDVIAAHTDEILGLVDQIGSISTTLSRFPSVKTGETQHLTANLNRISAELNRAATAPGIEVEAMNELLAPVIKITSSTAAHVDADLQDLAIGALADPNHHADPGSRLPDLSDADNFAGTLAYTLQRLRQKLVPPR